MIEKLYLYIPLGYLNIILYIFLLYFYFSARHAKPLLLNWWIHIREFEKGDIILKLFSSVLIGEFTCFFAIINYYTYKSNPIILLPYGLLGDKCLLHIK